MFACSVKQKHHINNYISSHSPLIPLLSAISFSLPPGLLHLPLYFNGSKQLQEPHFSTSPDAAFQLPIQVLKKLLLRQWESEKRENQFDCSFANAFAHTKIPTSDFHLLPLQLTPPSHIIPQPFRAAFSALE